MRKIILNIGLETRDTAGAICAVDVDALSDALAELTNGIAIAGAIVESFTERTLVAQFDYNDLDRTGPAWICEQLCERFNQDCVAIYYDYLAYGQLIGPGAAEWGSFDPDSFFLLEGHNLTAELLQERHAEVIH